MLLRVGATWMLVALTATIAAEGLRTPRYRVRRDEKESGSSAYGRGAGFYVGEPCKERCIDILHNVYCNLTTKTCECKEDFPVNIENKYCLKGSRLGEKCQYDQECLFFHATAECQAEVCRCRSGHMLGYNPAGQEICVPDVAGAGGNFMHNSDVTTMVSVICGLIIFTLLFCLVLRLFSRARFNRPQDRMASAAISPPPSAVAPPGDRRDRSRTPSQGSVGSRRASYTMLAPPLSSGGGGPVLSPVVSSPPSTPSTPPTGRRDPYAIHHYDYHHHGKSHH